MKTVLLDTSAYARYLSGNGEVLQAISQAETVYMSVFVLGELRYGFRRGNKELENRRILDAFLRKATVKVLDAGEGTSEFFALVKHNLKAAGTPIPINDVWIAAHALETGATLITSDALFRTIPNLLTLAII